MKKIILVLVFIAFLLCAYGNKSYDYDSSGTFKGFSEIRGNNIYVYDSYGTLKEIKYINRDY